MSIKNLKMSKRNIIECQKFQNFNQKCQKCHPKFLKCQKPLPLPQQWSRQMQNGQKFEFVLWRMEVTVNVNDRVANSAHNL